MKTGRECGANTGRENDMKTRRKSGMKKRIGLCLAVLMTAAFCLAGCGTDVSYTYDDNDKYMAGDREITDKIEKIDIDYLVGDVDIKAVPTETVSVKETAKGELEPEQKVHTWVDGSTLYVKFCGSGEDLSFKELQKHLTLKIPETAALAGLKADIAAGDLDVGLKNCSEIDLDAAAGNIRLTAEKVREFDADAAAGDCEFLFGKAPREAAIDAAAGDVSVQLPKNSNLTLKADIAAGDFRYDLPLKKAGEKYVCGTGKNKMKIDCAAGDVLITCP